MTKANTCSCERTDFEELPEDVLEFIAGGTDDNPPLTCIDCSGTNWSIVESDFETGIFTLKCSACSKCAIFNTNNNQVTWLPFTGLHYF